MTIGQRIAQKRKELGLSQEALGDQLGVSRQAIYKWEADAALPEIEKLVALSKLFGVPVGWLLGVEEEPAAETPEAEELNETQMRMVEEIVSRYLAAQPQPKKARRWPWVLAAAVVLVAGIHLFNRLDGLNNQYNYLQNSVSNISSSVNSQIGNIANRVEAILKSQNDLTADYGTELLSADPAANTATFALRAVPKTFVEGMDAVFLVDSGDGAQEVEAALSDGGVFSAQATTALTDNISLSVVFIQPDGKRQTQLLDNYSGLFGDSIPWVDVRSNFHFDKVSGGVLHIGEDKYGNLKYAEVYFDKAKSFGTSLIEVDKVKVGVFVNKKLVAWARECDQPDSYIGDWGDARFFCLPDVTVTLGEGDRLWVAALVTDNFGRQFMSSDVPYEVVYDEDGGELRYASDGTYDSDPASWILE